MTPLASPMGELKRVASRSLPMRRLNARMWGDRRPVSDPVSDPVSGSVSDPVSLGGCGRVCETGSWVPVFAVGQQWFPAGLASCDNAMLCDFCGPRVQAESRARFQWHFLDWESGGGTFLHLRLSFGHGPGDDLAPMLADLGSAFRRLRDSAAWKAAGLVDWVRVLHPPTWTPKSGFNVHFHVVGFVRPGHVVTGEQIDGLRASWADRVARSVGRRVSRSHGLFGRVMGNAMQALYAWHWADRDDDGEYHPQAHLDDDGGRYHPQGGLHGLAEAALNGDQRAWAVWAELCRALKGHRVVSCSKMLDRLWKAHEAEVEPVEPVELDDDPVCMVHGSLWEVARRRGLCALALSIGASFGAVEMARWLAGETGRVLAVDDPDGPCPRLRLRDGPNPDHHTRSYLPPREGCLP